MMAGALVRSIRTSTHGRFLVDVPAVAGPYPLLVGFHGYGENADRHLEHLRAIPGADSWLLVAVQGLHRFYASRTEEVVASWMTRQDREEAIADNVDYVNGVLGAIAATHATRALVFAGFSQGVAMAYRAAAFGARPSSGVIALGGDIPPDVRDRPGRALPPVLVGRGERDGYYTADKLAADVAHLQSAGVAAQVAVYEGGHEWTDGFRRAAGRFLATV